MWLMHSSQTSQTSWALPKVKYRSANAHRKVSVHYGGWGIKTVLFFNMSCLWFSLSLSLGKFIVPDCHDYLNSAPHFPAPEREAEFLEVELIVLQSRA